MVGLLHPIFINLPELRNALNGHNTLVTTSSSSAPSHWKPVRTLAGNGGPRRKWSTDTGIVRCRTDPQGPAELPSCVVSSRAVPSCSGAGAKPDAKSRSCPRWLATGLSRGGPGRIECWARHSL